MTEKAYYLHMRRLFPKMRLLFTDTDSVRCRSSSCRTRSTPEANLNGAALFDVAGKSKDPERDLSALSAAARSKAASWASSATQPGSWSTWPALQDAQHPHNPARRRGKEKRKIKGVPKKAVTNVRHLEYRDVLEEGSERRAAFAQLRSRAHEIAVETVEKKSLSPFQRQGLRPRRSQLAAAGALAQPGAAADAGRLRSATS